MDMRESVFCLSPLGTGWGLRIVDAMLTGCIPVIVQDGVKQPGDDVLPYPDFAVRIPESSVDQIEEILRAIPPQEARPRRRLTPPARCGSAERACTLPHCDHAAVFCDPPQVKRLQRGVRKFAPQFLWEAPDGRAYELVLRSLRHQLHLLQGVFLRESRAFEIDERFANQKPPGGWPDDRRRRAGRRAGRRAALAAASEGGGGGELAAGGR